MSWIREDDVQQAPIRNVSSILPEAQEAVSNMTRAVTFGASTLTRVQEETIATAVSVANKCRY